MVPDGVLKQVQDDEDDENCDTQTPRAAPRRLDRGAAQDVSGGAARERLRAGCLPGGGDFDHIGLPAAAARAGDCGAVGGGAGQCAARAGGGGAPVCGGRQGDGDLPPRRGGRAAGGAVGRDAGAADQARRSRRPGRVADGGQGDHLGGMAGRAAL